jgi:hypothetical protein
MAMNYEELDESTREFMRNEFDNDEASGNAYRSKALSAYGKETFPNLMRAAIISGNEVSLCQALEVESYFDPSEEYTREGVTRTRRRNIRQSAERLSLTEFSTWYVKGFAKRLIDEGVDNCQVCRGGQPKWEPGDCASHEGLIVSVREIYNNHRSRYWPEPGNKSALSIPFGPGCHHIICRVK